LNVFAEGIIKSYINSLVFYVTRDLSSVGLVFLMLWKNIMALQTRINVCYTT